MVISIICKIVHFFKKIMFWSYKFAAKYCMTTLKNPNYLKLKKFIFRIKFQKVYGDLKKFQECPYAAGVKQHYNISSRIYAVHLWSPYTKKIEGAVWFVRVTPFQVKITPGSFQNFFQMLYFDPIYGVNRCKIFRRSTA